MFGPPATTLGLIEPNFIEEIENQAREFLDLIILNAIKEGKDQAMSIYDQIRSCGIPMNMSTFYATLRELEREGLVRSEGARNKRYYITEKGEKYLEENAQRLERVKEVTRKLRVAKAIGIPMMMATLKELLNNLDKLSPEDRAEIMEALGTASIAVKKVLAKYVE
ncbi:hypothetical protein IPA_02690 [Ignicoccus pacificus DSM 13166]|uniref:Transcription regulator PadR N-terminal domain-containing protein n=1 Tax=Ignicoccus pacificus DSM 13166 TaxID=940294 RepID=A0A977KCM8_9CREN|nr:hypothetical protein IPA_02690 [Ignicoccus pacificus DSM 13166]